MNSSSDSDVFSCMDSTKDLAAPWEFFCSQCDALCPTNINLCTACKHVQEFEESGGADHTMWCAHCRCPCSYNSDPEVSTCRDCTRRDLADIEEDSSSESDSWARIKESKRSIAEKESKLSFLHLKFDAEPGCGGLKGDVVVIVENKTEEPLYAHKFILSSKSPVFFKMFEDKMQEGEAGIIRIDNTTIPVMRAVIKFCYSAEIQFSREVPAEDVFLVAHKYAINLLQKICEDRLIRTMSRRSLPRRIILAMNLNATKLKTAASKYFKKHFDMVVWDVLEVGNLSEKCCCRSLTS